MKITVALAGNPNSGKTTLFNSLTGSNQHVGNWPGVTVEKISGILIDNPDITVIDLPGIYSLSMATTEERIAKKYLTNNKPDLIINVVDSTNLWRSLFLTTQITELNIPTIVALNMYDIVEKTNSEINLNLLSQYLGCKTVKISALNNIGITNLLNEINLLTSNRKLYKTIKTSNYSTPEKRYAYIDKVVKMCYLKNNDFNNSQNKIDKIITNKYLSLPIFALIMFLIYYLASSPFIKSISEFISEFIFGYDYRLFTIKTIGLSKFTTILLNKLGCRSWIINFITDGILNGVRSVLYFIPQIFVLFFCIAILEGSGYMARIAYITDALFKHFGMSGKSVVPLILGTSCSVPAINASRTIDSETDRKISIITTSFIPCSAKLPIILLITSTVMKNAWWAAPSIYFLCIFAVCISAILLKKTIFSKNNKTPFILELPPYRKLSFTSTFKNAFQKTKAFVKKAGSIILVSSALIWILSNFNLNGYCSIENSFLSEFGKLISPIFIPLGFGNWQSTVAIISGYLAKENIVSTLNVLQNFSITETFTVSSGMSFLIFNMLSFPCIAALSCIYKELNNLKTFIFTLLYQFGFAYCTSLIVYTIMRFLGL